MGRPRTILVAFGLALALAACGSYGGSDPAATGDTADTGGSPSPEAARFPVTVEGTNGSITIDAQPKRIVSLSPTATEDLFAIGAGDQVIAVDDQSDFPPEAPTTDLSGFEPNVEAIAGYRPDLVVFATEPGDLGASLEALGITALQLDAAPTLEVAFDQIEQLGVATGHAAEAETVVADLRAQVDVLVERAVPSAALSFYFELDDTFYSVTSKTFIGQLFDLLGLENIADAAGKESGGYPQLSAEYIIESDPDLIFLADTECCGQTPDTVAERPGWDEIAAVSNGGVVPLDEDVAQRWGPRVIDLLNEIASAAESAEANAA
ncbi:MAG TPA: ABC transporter substrate-binding protein [Actinomycetota bacterium]|jgi:iron complex transport system substrate-binding protein|nr:ABC transporter substrate-binding protein [Actinomycetota bacterium]